MELDFSPEQKQLKEQVRRFLADRCDRKAVRAVLDGPAPYDQPLWRGLGELGVLGATIPEAHGGLGLGHLEACVLAEELGRAVAPVPYASSIALAAEALMLAGSAPQQQARLPGLASGQQVAALAAVERAGALLPPTVNMQARLRDGQPQLTGRKLAVADGDVADCLVVLARSPELPADTASDASNLSLYLVDGQATGLTRQIVSTIDPTRSHADLTLQDTPAELLGQPGQGWALLQQVLDRAAVLMAFEQLGGADRALEMACDYAQQRYAFGRPIGSQQAIKHMLADMYVSATLARSNCYYAAWALSAQSTELPLAAASARVSATQAALHCSRNNIQVHGGMGFTWETDCHLYYRRANQQALALGALSIWEDRLVDQLVAQRAQQQTQHDGAAP